MNVDVNQFKKGQVFFGKIGLTFQVVKTAFAASASWAVAQLIMGGANPVFAPLAAMLVIQVAIFDTIERALYRTLGTIGGVIIGMLISLVLHVNAFSIALVILLSFALTRALKFPSYLIIQVAISSLLVLFFSHSLGVNYIWARIFETMIGAVIACLVNIFVLPPNPFPRLSGNIYQVTVNIGEIFHQLALLKETNQHLYEALLSVRQLVPHVEEIDAEIEQAKRSLRYSPLQKKYRKDVEGLDATVETLERIVIQSRGIIRSMLDISVRCDKPSHLQPIMTEVMKIVTLFGSYIKDPANTSLYLLREALKNAYEVHKKHYSTGYRTDDYTISLNIGSIYTDAYRIFEEIEIYIREVEDEPLQPVKLTK